MIEKLVESSGNVIGFKCIGTITASDYQDMVPEVKALVEKEGNIRLLFDLSDFKWEKMEAWLADLEFGWKFRHNIEKMAIVGDKSWERWITHLARPFYALNARFFDIEDIEQAWTWLRG
jgi:hypothetical protein